MRCGSRLLGMLFCAGLVVIAGAGASAITKPTTRPTTRGAVSKIARPPAPVKPALPKPPPSLQKIFDGRVPGSVAQIKAMQEHVRAVSAYVTRATVGVKIGSAGGSGVIVTKDGYVLTCAHVTRAANVPVAILLPGGRRVRGKTLGANFGVDAGLIKITDKPKDPAGWPYCPMGKSSTLRRGQWCIATGHPGGFRSNRTPPVRLGRVLRNSSTMIISDCTIVSGDSGGPLFDTAGKVIGISSRIAGPLDANIHVPVDAYTKDWDRLVKGEIWGVRVRGSGAYLGVMGDRSAKDARIVQVLPGTAAAKAGIKPGDVVKKFDGKKVTDYASLAAMIVKKKPGDKVKLTVQRGKKTVQLEATLGRRGR